MKDDVKTDFSLFISGLLIEGMVSLGVMANPMTKKIDKDLEHASRVIDILGMLKEKTMGNLTGGENEMLDQGVHQLMMMYVSEKEKSKDGSGNDKNGSKTQGE